MIKLYKKIYILTLYLQCIFCINATDSFLSQETDLSSRSPDFISVLGGVIQYQPVRTSYGYMAAGDGRQIYGFSPEGKLLWQRTAPGRLKTPIARGFSDLIYGVTTDSKIFMMNPSGLLLWTTRESFEVTEAPVCGTDGRIFIRGENNISCYGLKGMRRWSIKTESTDIRIPVSTLNDGSILVFLARTSDGKSMAKRIDPFGIEKEDIIFTGKVTHSISCSEGTVLALSDGSIGLCSVNESGAYSKWILKQSGELIGISENRGQIAAVYKNRICFINGKTGQITSECISDIDEISFIGYTAQGLVICNKTKGICYSKNGSIAWNVSFPHQNNWNFIFPSDAGYIVFCMDNWVLEGYQTKLNLSSEKKSFHETPPKPYEYKKGGTSLQIPGNRIEPALAKKMKSAFLQGKFEGNEESWNSQLQNELYKFYAEWTATETSYQEASYLKTDIKYCRNLLELESISGIYFGNFPELIKKINDPELLLYIIHSAGITSFDPDGEILSALEYALKTKISDKDKRLLKEIADSTYEICRFMGKPSFFRKGNEILKYMLNPQFDKEIKDYALNTLIKIMEAEL